MTEAQKEWLSEHPNFSAVRETSFLTCTGWADVGYLFEDGKFIKDDGKTLFWGPRGLKVGRPYTIV